MACCILSLHPLPTQTRSEWCRENSSWNKSWFTPQIGLKCARSNSPYTGLSGDRCQATSFLFCSSALRTQTFFIHQVRPFRLNIHVFQLWETALAHCPDHSSLCFLWGFCLFVCFISMLGFLVWSLISCIFLCCYLLLWLDALRNSSYFIFRLLRYILFVQVIIFFIL